MWRAVVAVAHADSVVKPHEINFIVENTKELPLSPAQRLTLSDDIFQSCDVQSMFEKITSPRDKEDFFHFARAIAWSDGAFDDRERALIARLKSLSLQEGDRAILQSSSSRFQDMFIDENSVMPDKSFFLVIKEMMGSKAARTY